MPNRFYGEFDTERRGKPGDGKDFRTPFQIDRDRVLHTPAFRSLQNKTQVFWSGEYDFYRTRLTHSLEVAQIGRSICHWLKVAGDRLDEDFHIDAELVEAACLSHDLGHPPFGHAGERTLNHLMAPWGGFEGNAQTLRLLGERIFSAKRTGMDPTRAFADSVLKYKSLWSELKRLNSSVPENHFLYDTQAGWLEWVMGGVDFPVESPPGSLRDACKSIECQIMDWADDTAYSLNDLADSVRAGFLTVERIERWAEARGVATGEGTPLGELMLAMKRQRVDPFVGSRIGRYVRAVKLIDAPGFLSSLTHRYRFRLVVEEAILEECSLFKKLAFEVVFLSPQLKQLEHKGSLLLRGMWELLETRYVRGERIDGQDFQLLPEDVAREIAAANEAPARARLVCDYLAAMTDGDAVRTYKRLFTPDFGSIGDLVG